MPRRDIKISMNSGNGHSHTPLEVIDLQFPQVVELPLQPLKRPIWPAVVMFLLTVVTTLAVGSQLAASYANNQAPFSNLDNPFTMMRQPLTNPSLLLLGLPFSLTLLGILFAHEMGHYIACKLYGIDVSYPMFIPAPNLFGTFGAFIRIRSPFPTRRALFDVGIAGPIAGFVVAVPAVAYSIFTSKVVPDAQASSDLVLGIPALVQFFAALFHPGVPARWLLLSPVGCAAWFGLLATALNLLPIWQLDGGHILYSLANEGHRRISIAMSLVLIVLGVYQWVGWALWGFILLVLTLRFRHPPVMNRWEYLDGKRRFLALVALAIFLLCFTLVPLKGT
ncbi:MAG TPA: site-2 protease family protein [Candidatus Acidoferrum sp.]|nr:site-2 protease family protein [Candidatus Acidoferrum sp.]